MMVMTYNGWGDMPEDQREALDVFDHTDAARSAMLEPVAVSVSVSHPEIVESITYRGQHLDLKAALEIVMSEHGANLQRLAKHDAHATDFTPEVSDF